MKTKKAIEFPTQLESAANEVKKVKRSMIADTITNTMTLTPIFAMKAHWILKNLQFLPNWLFIIIAVVPSWYSADLIVRQMVSSQINGEGGYWIDVLSFILSFAGLSDGMFADVTSIMDAFTPYNMMKFVIITVLSASPIVIIRYSVKSWKDKLMIEVEGERVYVSEYVNAKLVNKAVADHIQEEVMNMGSKSLGKLGRIGKRLRKNQQKANAYTQETKSSTTIENFINR